MTFTTADLDALKEALISGATEVQIGDRRVKYKSQKEIIQAIKMIQSVIDGAPSETQNVISTTYTKGRK